MNTLVYRIYSAIGFQYVMLYWSVAVALCLVPLAMKLVKRLYAFLTASSVVLGIERSALTSHLLGFQHSIGHKQTSDKLDQPKLFPTVIR